MTQDIRVKLATEIIQVTGTVNSVPVEWLRDGDEWLATCNKSSNNTYIVKIKAINAAAIEFDYTFTLYYGLVLITDRTENDVIRVRYLRNAIVTGTATEQEVAEWETDLKGSYNYNDFNRVGSAMQFIVDLYRGIGYNINIDIRTDWKKNEYVLYSDFENYIENVRKLRSIFIMQPSTPEVPSIQNFDIYSANNLEKILLDLEFIINSVNNSLFYSNELFSGEV